MTTPLVSVILPAHNQEAFIADALSSLRFQGIDRDALEVVVIDDGSTDHTMDVVDSFSSWFPKLLTNSHPTPHGVSAARNRGTEMASGRYLAYLDPDDWYGPLYLRTCVEASESLDVPFVRTDHTRHGRTTREVNRAPEGRRSQRLHPLAGVEAVEYSTMLDYPYPCTGIFRSDLRDTGLLRFDESLATAEDREMMWRLHLATDVYAVISEPGFFYRRDIDGSLTAAVTSRQLAFSTAFDLIADHLHVAKIGQRITEAQWQALSLKRARQFIAISAFHANRVLPLTHGDDSVEAEAFLDGLHNRLRTAWDHDEWLSHAYMTCTPERRTVIDALRTDWRVLEELVPVYE